MSRFLKTTLRGLFSNGARTAESPTHDWLTGRVYAIPFELVWQTSLGLAGGGLRRWHLTHADDQDGVIRAERGPAFLRPTLAIEIEIGLTEDAQTSVDAEARAPDRRVDRGASARALALFLHSLDNALARALQEGSGPDRVRVPESRIVG